MKAEEMLNHLKTVIFPKLATLSDGNSSFSQYMKGAEYKINKPSLPVLSLPKGRWRQST